jgi:hypothetical protein
VNAMMPSVHGGHQKKMMDMTNLRNNQARSLDKYAYEQHQVHGQKIATMGGIPHQHNYMYPTSTNNGNSAMMGTTMVHLESISQRIFQHRDQVQQE